MYIRNIFEPIKYPYKLPSYALYRQELNMYKKMLNPVTKSVHFECKEECKESDISDDSSDSDEDLEENKDVIVDKQPSRNWIVNMFYSVYYMFKCARKYSYIFFKNMILYAYLFPYQKYRYARSIIVGSCVGIGIYYFIRHK